MALIFYGSIVLLIGSVIAELIRDRKKF